MISVDDSAAASTPLVYHDRHARVDRDPDLLAARLAQHYSMIDFGPRPGHERSFLHRSASAAAGDLMITCGYTSSIQGAIGAPEDYAPVNLCSSGSAFYQVERMQLRIDEDCPLFFSPGQEYRYTVDSFNGIVFHLGLNRLRETAAAMAGLGALPLRFGRHLELPRVVVKDGGAGRGCSTY